MIDPGDDFVRWYKAPLTSEQNADAIVARAKVLGAKIKRGGHTEKVLTKCIVDHLNAIGPKS